MSSPTCKVCGHENKFMSRPEHSAWAEDKRKCGNCDEHYCDKPETERKLFKYQDTYLDNRSDNKKIADKALFNLYELLKLYSESLLHKRFKASTYDQEILEKNKDGIALTLLEKYLAKEDFKIIGSFWGYMYMIAKWVLYDDKELPESVRAEKEGYELYSINYEYEDDHILQIKDENSYSFFNQVEEESDTVVLYKHFSLFIRLIIQELEIRESPYLAFCVGTCINSIISSKGDRSIFILFDNELIHQYVNKVMESLKFYIYRHL